MIRTIGDDGLTTEEFTRSPEYYLNFLLEITAKALRRDPRVTPDDYSNAYADYWRYYIGLNVIPAVGTAKVPIKGCNWKKYQDNPISEEQHNEWKKNNAFRDGMAVIAGQVFHRKDLNGYYFAGVDADNPLAITELLTRKGKTLTIGEIAQNTLVDQHNDKERIHFYVYTVGVQLRDKTSDIGKPEFDATKLPAFEVKASSKFLLFVAPSPHKTSGIRRIIGTYTPITLGYNETNDFQDHIDSICKKYGLNTAGSVDGNGNGNGNGTGQIPIHKLFQDDCVIYEGHNRHKELMRVMESLIRRTAGDLSSSQIIRECKEWNQIHCKPPLDETEFNKQWKSAEDFIIMSGNGNDSRNGNGNQNNNNNNSNSNSNSNNSQSSSSTSKSKTDSKPRFLKAYKYTTSDKGLAEEIFLECEKRPKFLFINPKTLEPTLVDFVKPLHEVEDVIINPEDINVANPNLSLVTPYIFKDLDEIKKYIEYARKLDISDLYLLVEYIWRNVIYTKEKEMISLLTNYTLYSYFQDLFEVLHYIICSGPPGWGKGAILVAFKLLAYRVVMGGDMSGANLIDLMGAIEKCQISLAEDELDNLDEDEKKKKIIKLGYDDSAMVPRTIDPTSKDRKLIIYSPYGCKIFAGEKPPDSKVLGGFNDRAFRLEAKKGKTRLRIKSIRKEMEKPIEKQSPRYRMFIDRITQLRKTLLIYRLIHHEDDLVTNELPLNIDGRSWELCGHSIQLYHTLNNKSDDDPKKYRIRDKIMKTLGYYLRKKGELDKKSLEGVLYRVIDEIFGRMDANPDDEKLQRNTKKKDVSDLEGTVKTFHTISYDEICNRFMEEVDGTLVFNRTIECADFGKISHDKLIDCCKEHFGGLNTSIGRDKIKKKALAFDRTLVKEAGERFDIVSEIKILKQKEPFEDSEDDKELWDTLGVVFSDSNN